MARLDQKRGSKSDGDSTSDAKSVASQYSSLTPKEAFEKFDTDQSGDIDDDEFFHLLESIGIKSKNEEYQEKLFKRYVKSGSKTIDYDGFKAAWLLLGNPKQELIDRGVKNLPKFATRYQLVRLLEKVIDDEERSVLRAKAEADRYRRIQESKNTRLEYIQKAKNRAGRELGAALDAAGQVYILGTGAHEQFCGVPKEDMSTSSFQQTGMVLMQSLWEERVKNGKQGANSNTAGIWGRKPRKVVLTDNTILALTDGGILSWGGSSNWHEVSSSQLQSASRKLMQTTPRSSTLLMNNELTNLKHMTIIQEEMDEKEARSAAEVEQMELVLRYFSTWPSHFDGTSDVGMVREHLLSNISYDQFLQSLLFRGKPLCEGDGFSKLEMADMLAKDILLEKEILGDSGQQELCDMECEISDLIKRKKAKSANFIRLKFADKWAPLSTEQRQRAIAEEHQKEADKRGNRTKREKDYMKWNTHRTLTHNAPITEHRGMLAGSITTRGGDINTPRGVSLCIDIVAGSNHAAIIVQDERSRSVYTWGISSLGRLGQGGGEHTFADNSYPTIVEELKGSDVTDMSLGQSHSAAVTRVGTLFLWGAGSSGQLGFGKMSDGKEFFCTIPTRLLIPSCKVVSVSCGACHTACIGRSGELYVWGCGDGGRLGLGRDRMSTLAERNRRLLVLPSMSVIFKFYRFLNFNFIVSFHKPNNRSCKPNNMKLLFSLDDLCTLMACLLGLTVMLCSLVVSSIASVRVMHNSMAPTLKSGDRICYIKDDFYRVDYKVGQVIVCIPPESLSTAEKGGRKRDVAMLVKRIDRVSGDTVSGRIVDRDNVFVLGDNRDNSFDSRHLGDIPLENILGRVILKKQPGFVWSRLGVPAEVPHT